MGERWHPKLKNLENFTLFHYILTLKRKIDNKHLSAFLLRGFCLLFIKNYFPLFIKKNV